MEPESSVSVARRRARSLRRVGIEFILASAFVAAILFGVELVDRHSPGYLRGLAILLPVVILTLWWLFYSAHIKGLEEFQQTIAIRSLAIACGATLWVTTAWGLTTLYLSVPPLPLEMVAPLAAFIYAIIRVAFVFRYR